RQLFKEVVAAAVLRAGIAAAPEEAAAMVPRSRVCHSIQEVRATVAEVGLPVVIRPSFTMGGLGSGMAHTTDQLERLAGAGLQASPVHEVLIEESVLGWKEYEL